MIKIAFFDVDGTLLPIGAKALSDNTLYALKKLKENGIRICMATGRGKLMVPKFEGVTFDTYLTFNGSYCYDEEGVICTHPMNKADVSRILRNTQAMGRAVAITNENFLVTNGTDPDLERYFEFGNASVVIDPDFPQKCEGEIYQMMMSCTENEYDQILAGTDTVKIAAWWDRAADLIPADGGKGEAIAKILDHYGFKKEEAVAFGDGGNDVAMLLAVGTGVAMGNAKESVKEVADVVCRSAEDDGVYHYCLEQGLI